MNNLPFDRAGQFFNGNLHTHCTSSDGDFTAEEVIRRYANPLVEHAGFLNLKGNLFDSALMKTSVIASDFRQRFLSRAEDPDAVQDSAPIGHRLLVPVIERALAAGGVHDEVEHRALLEALGEPVADPRHVARVLAGKVGLAVPAEQVPALQAQHVSHVEEAGEGLDRLAKEMPASWWAIPDIVENDRSLGAALTFDRLMAQVWFFQRTSHCPRYWMRSI